MAVSVGRPLVFAAAWTGSVRPNLPHQHVRTPASTPPAAAMDGPSKWWVF